MRTTHVTASWIQQTVSNVEAHPSATIVRFFEAIGASTHELVDAFTKRYQDLCESVDFRGFPARCQLAKKFYLHILESILLTEEKRLQSVCYRRQFIATVRCCLK
jgi:hypothetical protein